MGAAKRGPDRLSSAQLRARGSPLWKQREREEREAAKTVDPKDRFFTDDYGAGDTPEAKLPKAKSRKRAKKTKDSIDPPEWLTGPARALWTELGQQLIDADVLDIDQDLVAFSMMCRCYGDHLAALEIVDREGFTIKSATGALYQHPAVGVANKSRDAYLKIATQFGLVGPLSREII